MSKGSKISKAISLLPHYTEAQAKGGDNPEVEEEKGKTRSSKSEDGPRVRRTTMFKMEEL
jgi:hypothetical protein